MSETIDTIQPGDMVDADPAAMELIVRIMQKNTADAAWTTNQLLDAYKNQAETAEATLALIRLREIWNEHLREIGAAPQRPARSGALQLPVSGVLDATRPEARWDAR